MNHTPFRESTAQHRAQRMMSIAPVQFEELIISHISRRLELNNDKLDELMNGVRQRKNSITSITKASLKRIASPFHVMKSKPGNKGTPCADLEVSQQTFTTFSAVCKLIMSLSNASELRVEGLFRKSGNCARVKDLKQKLLEECSIDLTPYTTHDRATAIKNLLGDMPEPLLLARHFEAFQQAIALGSNGVESGKQRCLRVMQLLMLHLPRNNLLMVRQLLDLLRSVAEEDANKMDSKSLATLFAPHLLCSKQLQSNPVLFSSALTPATEAVKFMIVNSTGVFQIPIEFCRDVNQFLQSEDRLSEELKRASTPVKGASAVGLSPVSTSLTLSARSNEYRPKKDTTEAELAKLHTHIQSLPESEKLKLSKQLNDMTVLSAAAGSTPSRSQDTPTPSKYQDTPRKHFRSKSLGSSIKKHLPMFKSKTKHPLDLGGSLTAVNIDFDDKSSNSPVVIDSRRPLRTSNKRTADSLMPSSPMLSRLDCLHHINNEDVTPPKVAHTKLKENVTFLVSDLAKDKKCDTPLPVTENERDYLPVPYPKVRMLQRVSSPARCLVLPNPITCSSQDSPHMGSQARSQELQRPQNALYRVETAL